MPADARLCALPHLDLDGGAGVQVPLVYTEAPGRHLYDCIFPVHVEILVETAFSRVVADTQLHGGAGKTLMSVVADGAVAHGGEHDRH